jgi:hypothetical protein
MYFVSVFVFSTDFDDHGSRQGDVAQALTLWRHPVAYSVDLDVLHRAMCIALQLYHCITMVIEKASNFPVFFVIVDSVVAHNQS